MKMGMMGFRDLGIWGISNGTKIRRKEKDVDV
jgi:hypothetical protein